MPQIKVKSPVLSSTALKLRLSSMTLYAQASTVRAIGSHLPFSDDISAQIQRALASCSSSMLLSRRRVIKMADALQDACNLYSQTELRRYMAGMSPLQRLIFWLTTLVGVGAIATPGAVVGGTGSVKTGGGLLDGLKAETEGYLHGGEIGASSAFFGLPIGFAATGGFGYYKGEAGVHSGMEFNDKGQLDFFGAKAGAEGEFSLLRGKVSGTFGNMSGEMEGKLGNVSGKGEVAATLFADGKLSPQLQAQLKGKANVAEGDIKITQGDDVFGRSTKAHGEVLTAEASAEAGIGKISITDKNGKTSSIYGAKAEVGAEAYVAKGSVEQSINIFGIEISASVGGGVGGAGAKAGGYVGANGVSGSLGLGFVAGLDAEFSIDWSGFNLGSVQDFAEGAGKVLSDVGSAVQGTAENIGNFFGGLFH